MDRDLYNDKSQLQHKSLHMDIQLFVGNLYVSNKSEDSIPQLLP